MRYSTKTTRQDLDRKRASIDRRLSQIEQERAVLAQRETYLLAARAAIQEATAALRVLDAASRGELPTPEPERADPLVVLNPEAPTDVFGRPIAQYVAPATGPTRTCAYCTRVYAPGDLAACPYGPGGPSADLIDGGAAQLARDGCAAYSAAMPAAEVPAV